jgi:transposase-like protein
MRGSDHLNGRRGYTLEFKQRALARLGTGEVSLRQAAKELQVSVPTLIKWRKEVANLVGAPPRSGAATSDNSSASELERLRAEVARLTEERDRLRMGIAYLVGVKA